MQVPQSFYARGGGLLGGSTLATPAKAAVGADDHDIASTDMSAATVNFSSLATRLSKAATSFDARGASHNAMADKVGATIAKLNYPRTTENIRAKSLEVPNPLDAESTASAAAANAYVANPKSPNPFAGLSRGQLSSIVNDESGSFTTNERYAAYRQAWDEELAWRSKAVADAMAEYRRTGKLTDFFSSALAHFSTLPAAEQALYPKSYAADLQGKVDLDFNYFTHMPYGQAGKADISLASLFGMAQFGEQSFNARRGLGAMRASGDGHIILALDAMWLWSGSDHRLWREVGELRT